MFSAILYVNAKFFINCVICNKPVQEVTEEQWIYYYQVIYHDFKKICKECEELPNKLKKEIKELKK